MLDGKLVTFSGSGTREFREKWFTRKVYTVKKWLTRRGNTVRKEAYEKSLHCGKNRLRVESTLFKRRFTRIMYTVRKEACKKRQHC